MLWQPNRRPTVFLHNLHRAWAIIGRMALRAFLLALALALSAATTIAPSAAPARAPRAAPALIPNPLTGTHLYVSPNSSVRRYLAQHPGDPLIARIAAQPQAVWFDAGSNSQDISSYLGAAGPQLPVLVVYNVPGRDCGNFSAGGERSPHAYRAWLRRFAHTIGSRRAVVVLEPDALPELPCLPHGSLGLLHNAVRTLSAHRNITLYVDAGNAHWVSVSAIAARLRASGAEHFALNVANFQTTATSVAYGRRIVAALGGRGSFVVDTSRNGRGPAPGDSWCNPSRRALGMNPTTATGIPGVDAFLWVKAPGESDGSCNGGPHAGTWWPEYARGLALSG